MAKCMLRIGNSTALLKELRPKSMITIVKAYPQRAAAIIPIRQFNFTSVLATENKDGGRIPPYDFPDVPADINSGAHDDFGMEMEYDMPLSENFTGDESDFLEVDEIGTTNNLPGVRIRGILCPTLETHNADVAGQKYSELPIAHVSATYQNTLITITDCTGCKTYAKSTGGLTGFKNAKKKTNVAAQAVGVDAGERALRLGLKHIRVAIAGMGKGRLAACKGLELAGMQIVSITDNTVLDWGTRMPRKKRRL